MKKYISIDNENISFKNLVSGPAQIGRILNYIIFAGENSLKHKPGNRNDNFENNIGSAWCIEFMIGLGLVKIDSQIGDTNVYNIKLTSAGIEIYNILIENAILSVFDQASNVDSTLTILKNNNALNVINVFEKVFRESVIFKNLCIFLEVENIDKDFYSYEKNDFIEDWFGELCEFYTGTPYVRNGQGASTAGNRVPSLIQLLTFLNYAKVEQGKIIFNIQGIKNGIFDEKYVLDISDEHFISEYEKEEKILKRLAYEFGIEGNHLVTSSVRLSQAQLIFKERLKREMGAKCCLCGIENEQLLIASHIKDAAKCLIGEKADNNNGLLLCAMHDKLFDLALISFDFQNGKIMISDKINRKDRELCNINENMFLPRDLMNMERGQYLMWHNTEFYSNSNE